jgi:hypothetical protein
MKNILWGIGIIAIGLLNGHSVFTGSAGLLDYAFDGLGIFFIGLGIFRMVSNRNKSD